VRQFGFIDDKSANRHVNICIDAAHRQPTVYVSQTNDVAIVLTSRQQTEANFLISIKGLSQLGCDDCCTITVLVCFLHTIQTSFT